MILLVVALILIQELGWEELDKIEKDLPQKILERQVLSQILETVPELNSILELEGTNQHIEEGEQCFRPGIHGTRSDTRGLELAGL